MNINILASNFITYHVLWLDTKNNTIMPGKFTKIGYSTPCMTMTGLYVSFPIVTENPDANDDKTYLKFTPQSPQNINLIREYTRIESRMLDNYIQTRHKPLKKVNLLTKQLLSGFMKVYKETPNIDLQTCNHYCVKISGVWETQDECGLTYKLFGGNRILTL